ncbi:MAG: ribonuclease Z [Methanobacteriota archaeon]|nr:MAG: ribonuclease Z [Euryarchaeota archaeon]
MGEKVEVFFLGTSAGIPSVKRNMPSIALRWGGDVLLFDAGECCQRSLMKSKVGYGSIRNIFISHAHLDHFLGLFGLIETLRMTTNAPEEKLNIYAPSKLMEKLLNRWPFMELKTLKEGVKHRGKDYSVRAFRVKHEGESFGFVFEEDEKIRFNKERALELGIKGRLFSEIERKGKVVVDGRSVLLSDISYVERGKKVVYSGDTMYCERIVEEAMGADLLIHEATFDEGMEEEAIQRRHSTVKDAATIAEKAGVKMLALTHISARYDNAEMLVKQAKEYYSGEVVVAHDGMKLVV